MRLGVDDLGSATAPSAPSVCAGPHCVPTAADVPSVVVKVGATTSSVGAKQLVSDDTVATDMGLVVVDGRTTAQSIGSIQSVSNLSTTTHVGPVVVGRCTTAPGTIIRSVMNLSTATDVGPVVVDGRTTAAAIGSMRVVLQLSTTTDGIPTASWAISASKSDSKI